MTAPIGLPSPIATYTGMLVGAAIVLTLVARAIG